MSRATGERSVMRCIGVLALAAAGMLGWQAVAAAGQIDTAFLEKPWTHKRIRETEVHKYTVQWRQWLDRDEGLTVGIRFTAPTDRQTTWELSSDLTSVGELTPGVTGVRFLENTPTRQVIQMDVKVLWKTLQLTFEVEQEPPNAMRFRMVHSLIGEYRAVVLLKEATDDFHSSEPAVTLVEMLTWLKPAAPVPLRLLASVERMMFLRAARDFLKQCEEAYVAAGGELLPAASRMNFGGGS